MCYDRCGTKAHSYEYVSAEITKRNGTLLSTEYINSEIPLLVRCNVCLNIWKPLLYNVQAGKWCRKCDRIRKFGLAPEYVMSEIEHRGGLLISEACTFRQDRIKIRCLSCQTEWSPTFQRVLLGQWCPSCASNGKYTHEQVRKEIEKRGGILISKEYLGINNKIDIRCSSCLIDWSPTFGSVLSGHWCPACSKLRMADSLRHTFEFVNLEISKRGGELLSTKYVNNREPLRVKCLKCSNIWLPRFANIMSGEWCPTCGGKKKHSYDFIRYEIENRGGHLKSTRYIGSDKSLSIECDTCHHLFSMSYDSIKQGSWCPYCSESKPQRLLFGIIESLFEGLEVCNGYNRFDWLKVDRIGHRQEIDIFVPALKLAIEYDGQQHFKPISVFGGEKSFADTRRRDRKKTRRIRQHPEDVAFFIRFNYKQKITKKFVIDKLIAAGVKLARKEEDNE